MAIQELKNKDGTTSFKITISDGYAKQPDGSLRRKRKTITFKQPDDMGLRMARQLAKEKEIELQRQMSHQQITNRNITFSEAWDWYKTYYASNSLRNSTFTTLELIMNKHVLPELGHLCLDEITSPRITLFLNDVCLKKNPKTKRPFNPPQYYKDSYVNAIHSAISRVYTVSIKQGWIKDNPCLNAIKPRKNRATKMKPLEIDQVKDLLRRTNKFSVLNAIIQFQIFTGTRIGETLALTWDDIDFNKMTIDINKTVYFTNGKHTVGPPKTENSYRLLGMSLTLRNLLLEVKKEQDIRKRELRDSYINPKLVFTTPEGDYHQHANVNNRLNAVKKGTDYEYITVHFLRHCNATLLLNQGVDLKTISAHLGHNNINITANIYADILRTRNQQIARLVELNLEEFAFINEE